MNKIIVTIIVIIQLSGCATTLATKARFNNKPANYSSNDVVLKDGWEIYPATKVDIAFIRFAGFGVKTGSDGHGQQGWGYQFILAPLMIVVGVIDTVISLATDTVFLPYDIYLSKKTKSNNSNQESSEN